MNHLVTVDAVEQRTGLDFFWQLPDAEEDAMEAVNWPEGLRLFKDY